MYGVSSVAASGKRAVDSVDSIVALMHDNPTMPSSRSTDNRRRSSRIFTRVPVKIRGMNSDGNKFREGCQTIVVNAHGGLLYLNESVEMGGQLQMTIRSAKKNRSAAWYILATIPTRGRGWDWSFCRRRRISGALSSPTPDARGRSHLLPSVNKRISLTRLAGRTRFPSR